MGIDEPLAMEKNSQMYYYHADGLGSIIALTNASGSIAQAYSYDSFGNITSGTPTITQPYTYTGREYDPETGLYFYRARYYDPKAGRFLQRDPIGFSGGDVNLYAYVLNDPINLTDPDGLKGGGFYPPVPFPAPSSVTNPYRRAPGASESGPTFSKCQWQTIYRCVWWCCDYDWSKCECRSQSHTWLSGKKNAPYSDCVCMKKEYGLCLECAMV